MMPRKNNWQRWMVAMLCAGLTGASAGPAILFPMDQAPTNTGNFKITNAVTADTNYWGTLKGSGALPGLTNGATANTGNAWQFNKGYYLSVGPNPVTTRLGDLTHTTGLSVGLWVKYVSQTTDNYVRLFGLGGSGETVDAYIQNVGTPGVGKVQFNVAVGTAGGGSVTTPGPVLDGNWHHLLLSLDFGRPAQNALLYVDGVAVVTNSISPINSFTNAGSLNIGARGNGSPWGGAIDQFVVHTNALQPADVAQLFSAGTVTNYTPLITVSPASALLHWTNGAANVTLPVAATITDDGLPNPPGRVTNLWSLTSGAGNVSFSSRTNAGTLVTFTNYGDFVLRCTANDGALTTFAEVAVHIVSPLEDSIAQLQVQVNALPAANTAQQLKKAVLNLALEQATNCIAVNYLTDASNRVADVQSALTNDANVMAAMNVGAANIGSLVPPITTNGNPYLVTMQTGLSNALAVADVPWGKTTTNTAVLTSTSGNYYMRDVGEYMEAYLWLFVNPASSYRTNVEVMTRLLRRAHAYADTVDVQDSQYGAGSFFYDDFAIAPFSGAIREFARLYPGLLLPSQKAMWDRAMTKAGATMWLKIYSNTDRGRYANIDVSEAYEALNFGLYLTNQAYLDRARWLIDMRTNDLYADGAWAYIWTQNESLGYHSTDTDYLSRYWLVSGYSLCTNLIQRSEWYGPVSNGRGGEFWTMPSWKQLWNRATPDTGGEQAVAFSGNPYLRWMQDTYVLPGAVADTASWSSRRWDATFYRNDIAPQPLPDNYTILDRNIVGPNAWYGTWHYAAPGRDPNDTEPGEITLMGAAVQETNATLWNAIVMGVYPRVRESLSTNQPGTDGGKPDWAWLTSKLTNDYTLGRDFSAISAAYRLHKYGSSTKGAEYNWRGKQLWLGLPDRLVGWLSVAPDTNSATAYEVDGVVRLGTGGTVNSSPKTISDLGGGSYRYGDLRVRICDHNYGALQPIVVPYRLAGYPATEITLQDAPSISAGGTSLLTYTTNNEYQFAVEVRPASVTNDAVVTHQVDASGIRTLSITVNGSQFLVIQNPSAMPKSFATNYACPYPLAAWFTGWQSQSAQMNSIPVSNGLAAVSTTIPAGGQIVFVNTTNVAWLQPGWANGTAFFTQPTPVPVIGGIQVIGGNMVLSGSNGTAGANYLVLATTNLALPVTNWTVIATNQFGPGGSVNFTNPQNLNSPQIYYRLRLP